MTSRLIFVTATFATLLSSSAFAEDDPSSASATASRVRLQVQAELLPLGSASIDVLDTEVSTDTAVAYGVSGAFDYAITRYFSVGVAPRVVFNVKSDEDAGESEPEDDADTEIDLRARLVAHYPVKPGLELFAALSPGYTIVMTSAENASNATGFALGGSLGATYDISPKMFISGEVGYQRAFTSADVMVGSASGSQDVDVSYMHVGLGAGTRF